MHRHDARLSVITIATHVPNQVSGVGFVCRKVGLRSVVVRGRPCFEPIVGAVILSTPFTRLANVLVVVVGGASCAASLWRQGRESLEVGI